MTMKSVSPATREVSHLAKSAPATAFFGETADGSAVVGIGNIRVLVTKNDGTWTAQGLEIDYAADGATLDDVKREFEAGLMMTLQENIKVFGNIEQALRVAPADVWHKFLSNALCGRYIHSNVAVQTNVSGITGLDFYEQKAA